MASLVLKMSVSLDGYVAPPDGSPGWEAAGGPLSRRRALGLPEVRRLGRTTIVSGDLTEGVTRLKQEHPGGYLLAQGGARFARSLVKTGLIGRVTSRRPPRRPGFG